MAIMHGTVGIWHACKNIHKNNVCQYKQLALTTCPSLMDAFGQCGLFVAVVVVAAAAAVAYNDTVEIGVGHLSLRELDPFDIFDVRWDLWLWEFLPIAWSNFGYLTYMTN